MGTHAEKAEDLEYHDHTVTEVTGNAKDGWEIKNEEGWSLWIGKASIEPKPGMTMRYWGRGIGFTVRGIDIDGVEIWYHTPEEEERLHKAQVGRMNRTKKEDFSRDKKKLDRAYNQLPDAFKRRIDRFRKGNKDFRWKFEPYELFCCKEAVKITKYLKSAAEVRSFLKMSAKLQQSLVPNLAYRDHSGNTFGTACQLALLYVTDPDLVVRAHGAMVALAGCDEYGCTHEEEGVS